jgi:hypothetical protein
MVLRVKLTGLAFVEFVVVSTSFGQKRAKEARKNLKKDTIPKTYKKSTKTEHIILLITTA